MLRPVLIGLVVLNGALLAAHWGGAGQRLSGGPREPERLRRQLHPEWLQVTPGNAASGQAPAAATAAPRAASSTASSHEADTQQTRLAMPLATGLGDQGDTKQLPERVCLESGPFDAVALAAVQRLLREAGVPEQTWQTRIAPAALRHVLLMGRYDNPELLQRKTGELRRRGVPFTELHSSPDIPAKYLPGLVLGRYADAGSAQAALSALQARGVVSARLVTAEPHVPGTVLRVASAADAGLRARATALTLPGRQGWRQCASTHGAARTAASRLLAAGPQHLLA